jgi:hypothetical protein
MASYRPAAICRRGHVITGAIDPTNPVQQRCHTCGAQVLTKCEGCGARLRGLPERVAGRLTPPDFCDECGSPHPWLTRQGRIYMLQNMLDEESLDPALALEVREQLEALTDPDLEESEQRERWERVRQLAPTFWDKSGAQKVLETVVSSAIKSGLGLG